MTEKQAIYAKSLRRQIMAMRANAGISKDDFYILLRADGYGDSLRALSVDQLLRVKASFSIDDRPPLPPAPRPEEFQYDAQCRFIHHLMLQADWDTRRLSFFTGKHYNKIHLNTLTTGEKSAIIKMLKGYVDKRRKASRQEAK